MRFDDLPECLFQFGPVTVVIAGDPDQMPFQSEHVVKTLQVWLAGYVGSVSSF
jgi:hypothetical protein